MTFIPEPVFQWRELAEMARPFGFEPPLVLALIWQESSGNKWAFNPEPQYRFLWDMKKKMPFRKLTPQENIAEIPPADFSSPDPLLVPKDAEWWAQQSSWGLIQVMGAVAREQGFNGPFLTELLEPERNLQSGLQHLRKQFNAAGTVRDALRRYNGGPANPDYRYADGVLTKYDEVLKKL